MKTCSLLHKCWMNLIGVSYSDKADTNIIERSAILMEKELAIARKS